MSKGLLGKLESGMEGLIFASRWLQAPLYLGLIVTQLLYVYKFIVELIHLTQHAHESPEAVFLVTVLGLIDVTMVANLLTTVIMGGYVTFVSKLDVGDHPDKPDWLSHIDPGSIKVKLASSLIGISSIHLLKSFIELSGPNPDAAAQSERTLGWQIAVHATFVLSTILLAATEYIMQRRNALGAAHGENPGDAAAKDH